MSVTKKNISNKISSNLAIKNLLSDEILNSFFNIIKTELNIKQVKINNFGTFKNFQTKERIGRNPKTLQTYVIRPINKIKLSVSKIVREKIN